MKDVLTSIRRTPYQSLAAFMVLFFTTFLSVALFVGLTFLYSLLGYVETRPQISAYFLAKTSEADVLKVRDTLVESGKVKEAKYISKQEAFERYKNLNKDNPLLLEMVSAEILPPSLEIYATKPSYMPEIAAFLRQQGGIDEVSFQQDIVDRLVTLTDILRKTSIIFYVFLIIMSIIVLTTTFSFKIAIKREEIELLRLLGATPFYIKKPFLGEAILFGITAVLLAFSIVLGILMYLQPFLQSYLRGVEELIIMIGNFPLKVWPLNPEFLGVTLLFASIFSVSIAFIASYRATGKYAK